MSVLEIVASLSGIIIASLLSFLGAVFVANRSSKADVEETLWNRAKGELDKMSKRIDALEANEKIMNQTITKQAATIQQQGALILQLRERVRIVESENAELKAENAKLKNKTQGKMGL